MADPISSATIDSRRVVSGTRPSYFDAELRAPVAVSKEMEEFAILLDPGLREELVDRLRSAGEANEDFDAILKRAVETETADAILLLTDFDKRLSDFSAFRGELLATPQSAAPEVAKIQHDLRGAQGAWAEAYDYNFHRRALAKLTLDVHTFAENNPDAARQRESWSEVLGKYA